MPSTDPDDIGRSDLIDFRIPLADCETLDGEFLCSVRIDCRKCALDGVAFVPDAALTLSDRASCDSVLPGWI